jgi:hypothetical protein
MLNELSEAIVEAIEALKSWDHDAFEAAVERQQALCDHLSKTGEWKLIPGAEPEARQICELNRSCERLLRHSRHWTRTLQLIYETSGGPASRGTSVHFRG